LTDSQERANLRTPEQILTLSVYDGLEPN
jgi:hypothetical protein